MVQVGFGVSGNKEVIHDLNRFRINLTQAKPAFVQMADIVARAQREQFNTEGEHYGNGWPELSPAYSIRKNRVRPGRGILNFDGVLQRAAAPSSGQGFSFYKVGNKSMEVGVSYNDVPYAQYHQEGMGHNPVRLIMGQPTKEDQKNMTKILHEHIMRGTSNARS